MNDILGTGLKLMTVARSAMEICIITNIADSYLGRWDFCMKLIVSPHSDCECRVRLGVTAMLTFGTVRKLQFFALK